MSEEVIASLEAENESLKEANRALQARLGVHEPVHVPKEYPKALHRTVLVNEEPSVESVLVQDSDEEACQKSEGFA